jgi:hypothetical protein
VNTIHRHVAIPASQHDRTTVRVLPLVNVVGETPFGPCATAIERADAPELERDEWAARARAAARRASTHQAEAVELRARLKEAERELGELRRQCRQHEEDE